MKIWQIDSFTNKACYGNPAGVCILEKPAEDKWMQLVAREMNLSETAFIFPEKSGYHLRWFTPQDEVDLCGHATLATAHLLFEKKWVPDYKIIHFHTKSGLLKARYDQGWIELDFPSEEDQESGYDQFLAEAFMTEPLYIGRNRMDYILEVDSEKTLRNLTPDMEALKKLDLRGFIVTSSSEDPQFDFISRFFAPALGIDEDPVTGSAHCCLGPYWMRKTGKKSFTAFQASERGGILKVRVEGNRILISGQAVTVFEAELFC